MEHTTRRRQTVTQIDRLECDRCHRAFEPGADVFEVEEFLRLNTMGGFGAVLGDGVRVQIDLCQHCWGEVLGPLAQAGRTTRGHPR